jgi:DNA-binding response OmpR family regulator
MRKKMVLVDEARDGVEAIRITRQEAPDLMLFDLGLPGHGGFAVMERLQMVSTTARIPVIVVSARDAASVEADFRRSGALAYLAKPVNGKALISLVAQIMEGEGNRKQAHG